MQSEEGPQGRTKTLSSCCPDAGSVTCSPASERFYAKSAMQLWRSFVPESALGLSAIPRPFAGFDPKPMYELYIYIYSYIYIYNVCIYTYILTDKSLNSMLHSTMHGLGSHNSDIVPRFGVQGLGCP